MKTLIINGSPRKNGGTASMIAEFKKRLKGEVEVIDTYYSKISPCVDCRYCWENPKCIINDEMQNVYRMIDQADNIVIASPIYFAELTGSILQWASRLQYIWVAKTFRKSPCISEKIRNGGVILVDGGDGVADTALAMAKRLLRTMGAEFKGLVHFSGTDKKTATLPNEDEETLKKIDELAEIFNEKHSND